MYKIIGGDGKEYGPITAEQMRQWILEGRVNGQTQVLAEGGTEWKPLGAYPELAPLLGSRPTAPTASAAATYGGGAIGRGRRDHPLAVTGLILGVVSLFAFCCCLDIPVSLVGLVLSWIALIEIGRQPDVYSGKGLAIAGIVTSALGLTGGVLFRLLGAAFRWQEIMGPMNHINPDRRRCAVNEWFGRRRDRIVLRAGLKHVSQDQDPWARLELRAGESVCDAGAGVGDGGTLGGGNRADDPGVCRVWNDVDLVCPGAISHLDGATRGSLRRTWRIPAGTLGADRVCCGLVVGADHEHQRAAAGKGHEESPTHAGPPPLPGRTLAVDEQSTKGALCIKSLAVYIYTVWSPLSNYDRGWPRSGCEATRSCRWKDRAEWKPLSAYPELAAGLKPPSAVPPTVAPNPWAARASSKIPAGICGILLGSLGIHKFILSYTGAGLVMLLLTVLTCFALSPVLGIIGLIEGIIYLCKSDEDFCEQVR